MPDNSTGAHLVVGSGHAGVSCAMALVRRGLRVTLVDAGLSWEKSALEAAERLKRTPQENWDTADLEKIKEPLKASPGGVIQKLSFGSNHMYGDPTGTCPAEYRDFAGNFSFAQGGFSTVWGGAMLPAVQSEIDDWPITAQDLAPYYREVLRFVPWTGETDAFDDLVSVPAPVQEPLRRSHQAINLLSTAKKRQPALEAAGLTVGASRLAIHTEGDRRCRNVGLCLYGCPFGSIYSTLETLAYLKAQPGFEYLPGRRVRVFRETETEVILEVEGLEDTTLSGEIRGTRLYLGAGVLSTARIVLESAGAFGRMLRVRDSQMFVFPFLSFRTSKTALEDGDLSIPQCFCSLKQAPISDKRIHLQISGVSDIVVRAFQKLLPAFLLKSRLVSQHLLGRLMIVQGFLHSSDSSGAELSLDRTVGGKTALSVKGLRNERTRGVVKSVVAYMSRKASLLGGFVFPGFFIAGAPGNSFHLGGTLPMSREPGPYQCDTDGRLHGFSRVHIVDASSFPSLPASTIAFTTMANAFRIGANSPEL